jgi:HAD superfamily hydrolase (TIGR01484 family)
MRYHALATDYDGTIAHHGSVDEPTLQALRRLRDSGRKLILVTGRELEDLLSVFPHPKLFDRIVTENGAQVYRPASKEKKALGPAPPKAFVELLRQRGVTPLSVGSVIVATTEPHETTVLQAIRDLGLELQVIFNKGAVMVLPSGVNKATGLTATLPELGLSPHNVAGVGDAENDHALLDLCECGAAVANALPALKEHADIITRKDHGAGVAELIDMMIDDDLRHIEPRLKRHEILLGFGSEDQTFHVKPYGANILVGGSSGSGKSTLVAGLIERLMEEGYQACIIDPEGDYAELDDAIVLGDAKRAPGIEGVMHALEKPHQNIVASLIGIKPHDRPGFFHRLLPALTELRARTGRPHWIIIDEAHHVLPEAWQHSPLVLPSDMQGMLLVAVHPGHIALSVLRIADFVIAIGDSPRGIIDEFSSAIGRTPPQLPQAELDPGQAVGWVCGEESAFRFRPFPPKSTRRRHLRKYAKGELPPEESFYFVGPERKLRLRAQNLQMFLQMAEGVDDETWMFHLRRGDYSDWFGKQLKDEDLAKSVAALEQQPDVGPETSRAEVRSIIEQRYTAAA